MFLLLIKLMVLDVNILFFIYWEINNFSIEYL